MAGAYTAGIANISIVPDLKGFKRRLESEIKEHLKDYTVSFKGDDKDARRVVNGLERDMREKLGAAANNIPIGFDDKSSKEAIRKLREVEKQMAKNARAQQDFFAGMKQKFQSAQKYYKALGDLEKNFLPNERDITRTSARTEARLKSLGALHTKTAKDAAKSVRDQARAVDELASKTKTAENNRVSGLERVQKAMRAVAELEAKEADKVSAKARKDRQAELENSKRAYDNLVATQAEASKKLRRGIRDLRSLEGQLFAAVDGPAEAARRRQVAQASVNNLKQALSGKNLKSNEANTAARVLRDMQRMKLENDTAAARAAQSAVAAARDLDTALRKQATAYDRVQDATERAQITELEYQKTIENFSDDDVRMARSEKARRDANRRLQDVEDLSVTAATEVQRAQNDLARADQIFQQTVQSYTNTNRTTALLAQGRVHALQAALKGQFGGDNQSEAIAYAEKAFKKKSVVDIKNVTDQKFTKSLIKAGRELDTANRMASESFVALERATRNAALAQAAFDDTAQRHATNARMMAQANNALVESQERVLLAQRRRDEAETRVRLASTIYRASKEDVDKQSKINVFSRASQAFDRGMSNLFGEFSQRLIFIGRYISAITQIARTAGIAMAALGAVNLVPVIGSLASMANTLALLPALATGAAAAIATIAIGSSGIMDAFKAATKMTKNDPKDAKRQSDEIASAQKAQANAARQHENAVEGVSDAIERQEDAVRAVADAQEEAQRTAIDGARRIRDAEEEVVDAKKDAKDAERDLARARKDAARDVRDLNDALKEGSLSEEEAILGVERARERIRELARDPKATSLDRREAQVALKRSYLNVENTRKRNQDLREQAAKANAVGIEGSDGVVDAKENLANAREGVTDAQQNLVETREDAARSNEQAARRVSDAQRQVRDAERGIRDANRAVADAAAAMAEANQKLNEAQSGIDSTARDEYEQAMAKLSPAARSFVETARSLGDEWTDLRQTVQERLFDDSDDSLMQLAGHLPILKEGLGGIAQTMNYGVRSAIQALSTEGAKLDFAKTLGNTTIAAANMSKAMGPLALAWREMSTVGSEFLPRISDALSDALIKFSGKISDLAKNGGLERMIDRGLDMASQFGRILGNIGGALRGVFGATSEIGDSMLDTIERLTGKFEQWAKSTEGQTAIRDFFQSARDMLAKSWEILTMIVDVATTSVIPAIQNVSTVMFPIINGLAQFLQLIGPQLTTILTAFMAWRAIGPVLGGLQTLSRGLGTALFTLGPLFQKEARDKIVAGLGNIRDQTKTTAGRFSLMERGAGAAVTGIMKSFGSLMTMMGGPLGLAIMAATGLWIAYSNEKRRAKEETDRLREAEERLQQTLDAKSGQATQRTRDEFTDSLAARDEYGVSAFDRADDFGVDSQDLVNAGMGDQSAKARLDARLNPVIEGSLRNSDRYQSDLYEWLGLDSSTIAAALANDKAAIEKFRLARNKFLNTSQEQRPGQASNMWDLTELKESLDDAGESAATLAKTYNAQQINIGVTGADQAKREIAKNGEWLATREAEDRVKALGLAIQSVQDGQFVVTGTVDDRVTGELEKMGYQIEASGEKGKYFLTDDGSTAEGNRPTPLSYQLGQTDPTFRPKGAPVPPPPPGAPAPEGEQPAPESVEINPDAIVYEDVEMPDATVEAPELNVEGQDVPGAVTDVPKVDYAPALGAFKTYGEHIADIFKEKIEPSLTRMIELQDRIGPSMRESADIGIPAMDELGETTGRLNESFKVNIAEGALVQWDKLLPGIGLDIFDIQTKQFPMLMTALTTLKESFRIAVVGIGDEFIKIRGAVATPLNWVIINALGGLKNAWNNVREVIPSLKEWTITAKPIEGYNTGGIMSGYSPGVDDRLIAVGGGEAIMRPEFTRAMGASWINEMNAAARNGGVSGVRKLREKWAGAYNQGGIVQAMTDAVKEKFPMMDMTSGLRFTDDGYHSKGMAADFSNAGVEGSPEMRSLAGWIADNFPPGKTLQLIHRPFNRNIGQGVGWVGDGVGFYGESTMEDHRHHVHWATDQLVSADGTSAPAPVGADGGAFSMAAAKEILERFTAPVDAMRKSMPDFGPALMGGPLATNVVDSIIAAARGAIGKGRGSLDSGTTPWDISAGVEQWDANIRAALAREGFEVNERNVQLTKMQMQTESGGNPNIVQQVQDVNSGGNEAVGLMQVVPGTFATHRNPDLPNDRTNPDASLSAALRYYRSKYGEDLGTMWGQGHGYDEGGWLQDGEIGINKSGKPEPVFTNSQWGNLTELIEKVGELGALLSFDLGLPVMIVGITSKVVEKLQELLGHTVSKAAESVDTSVPAATDPAATSTEESDPLKDYQGPLPPVTDPALAGSERDAVLEEAIKRRDAAQVALDQAGGELKTATGQLMEAQSKGELTAEQLVESQRQLELAKQKVQQAQGELDRANDDINRVSRGLKPNAALSQPINIDPSVYGGQNYKAPVGTAGPADGDSYGSDSAIDPALLAEADSYFAEGGDYRNENDPTAEAQGSILDGYPQRIADAGMNFLKANVDQFKSDLGYRGGGMLSNLFSEGQKLWDEYGKPALEEHIHYHVVDIDEAMRRERVRQQQQSKTYFRR